MRLVVLLTAVLWPGWAAAYKTSFLGWARDGAFYVYESSGTDDIPTPTICATGDKIPTGWPKGVTQPAEGLCTELCEPSDGDCGDKQKKRALRWVVDGTATDAKNRQVTLRKLGELVIVSVSLDGKVVARNQVELSAATSSKWIIKSLSFAPQGRAVAVELGLPEVKLKRGEEPPDGYGPPQELVIVRLDGPPPTGGDRAAAFDANKRGMKAYKSKDWATASREFRAAIAADDSFFQARYNLACVLALAGEKRGALDELKALAKSSDPLAKAKLDKARSDPDFASLRADPEAQSLVGKPPAGE
jgi:hypothetical protein